MSKDSVQKKYRGIRVEDLDVMNPDYSCIICSELKNCQKTPTKGYPVGENGMIARMEGKAGEKKSCPQCNPVTEEVFAFRYCFD